MIGGGGMGSVYLAKQISLQRLVALKILRPELAQNGGYMERFFYEVRLLAKLGHPCIVQAYEAGMDKGQAFFAMEYISGMDMKTVVARSGRLKEQEVLDMAKSIARTLKYAWNHFHLIHRDIKPANIMRLDDGSFKLLDLGISKQMIPNTSSELTSANALVGTPTYISPEQASAVRDLDFRADIYSLGISMFQLLNGLPPYHSPSSVEVIAMHFKSPVPDIRSTVKTVSAATAGLIKDMMSKDREDRPGSWDEVIDRIEKAERSLNRATQSKVGKTAVSVKKARAKTAPSAQDKRKILYYTAAGLCVLLCLLCILILLIRKSAEQPAPAPVQMQEVSYIVPEKPLVRPPEITLDELREQELKTLYNLSVQYEDRRDYEGALGIWTRYQAPERLKNDKILRNKIRDQQEFLRQQIEKHKYD